MLRIRTISVPSDATYTEHGVDAVLASEGHPVPHPRERLYDNHIVVVAAPGISPEADALELVATQPHVVVDTEWPVFPYSVLEEYGVHYRVGRLVSDFLLVPYLVASSGGVALLR